jgi:hypothetical protein
MTIKGLLNEGLTYIQVGRRLEALRLRKAQAQDEIEDQPDQVTALAPSPLDASSYSPAFSVLADTLHTVADGQQLVLGSQQANRDLLSVVVQDNFGLKEENAKLRDRMLELERDLSEIRRQDANRREEMEERLGTLEAQLRAPSRPPNPAPPRRPRPQTQTQSERSGCLGQIFGR